MNQYRISKSGNELGLDEKIIIANSIISAKQQASSWFPTKGAWTKLDDGSYLKTASRRSNVERLVVTPIFETDKPVDRMHINKLKSIATKLRIHFVQDLGWDNRNVAFSVEHDGIDYEIFEVAEKRGYRVFFCEYPFSDPVRFQKELRKISYENVVLYAKENVWVWQLLRKRSKPIRIDVGVGIIPTMKFSLSDEESISLLCVCNTVDKIFSAPFKERCIFDSISI